MDDIKDGNGQVMIHFPCIFLGRILSEMAAESRCSPQQGSEVFLNKYKYQRDSSLKQEVRLSKSIDQLKDSEKCLCTSVHC